MTQLKSTVTAAATGVSLLASVLLAAQEVTDVPVAYSSSTSTASSIQEKISETVSGVVSGEISAAKKGLEFDQLLQHTFMRITDCWTLCRQEMLLAKESARKEAIQTAKDIFRKRDKDDDSAEGSRKSILDRLPPLNLNDPAVRQAAEDVAKDAIANGLLSGQNDANATTGDASASSAAPETEPQH
ncbi:MAG: hypothetical protein PUC15_04110 [Lentisphaeria bacterium]|nr:hypothetical protein [Lentisphaeria bacterium]